MGLLPALSPSASPSRIVSPRPPVWPLLAKPAPLRQCTLPLPLIADEICCCMNGLQAGVVARRGDEGWCRGDEVRQRLGGS